MKSFLCESLRSMRLCVEKDFEIMHIINFAFFLSRQRIHEFKTGDNNEKVVTNLPRTLCCINYGY